MLAECHCLKILNLRKKVKPTYRDSELNQKHIYFGEGYRAKILQLKTDKYH